MKSNFNELKDLITEMNDLNDQISFIKFNNDEGVKFDSVEDMKDFFLKVENGNLDYLFDDVNCEVQIPQKELVESFNHTKNDIYFFLYTYEKDDKFITYLSMKHLKDDHVIDNLCGKENKDKESAHNWFEELKENILNTNIDELIETLIIGVKNTIKSLKIEMQNLASVG
ncbi:MAG: hypothetical protein NC483_01285 [Ruminococcus sp.]|nr:hypothetical protein [Ruminococcus sp.]